MARYSPHNAASGPSAQTDGGHTAPSEKTQTVRKADLFFSNAIIRKNSHPSDNARKSAILTTAERLPMLNIRMNGLDIRSLAETVAGAKDAHKAWSAFSGELARHGLSRTALHDGLDLSEENPFRQPRHSFGHIWDEAYDAKVRAHQGSLRDTGDRDLAHLKPTLMFLSWFSTPLLIEHRDFIDGPTHTAFTPLCRHLVETKGQYHALALPLTNPASGRTSILSVWGDEDRAEVGQFLRAHATVLQLAGQAFLSLLTDSGEGPPLSSRERQVLALYSEGAQTQDVADALRLSERSVREYLRRAQVKLDTQTRTAAVARAIRRGLI